jgi:hypothetical protein
LEVNNLILKIAHSKPESLVLHSNETYLEPHKRYSAYEFAVKPNKVNNSIKLWDELGTEDETLD